MAERKEIVVGLVGPCKSGKTTIKRQLSIGRLSFSTVKGKAVKAEIIAAICEALGNIGTSKSRKTLQKLNKQKDSLWQNKAQRALTKIAAREAD